MAITKERNWLGEWKKSFPVCSTAEEKNGHPFGIESLLEIQLSKRDVLETLCKGRTLFTIKEWKDLLLRSVGLEPSVLGERTSIETRRGTCRHPGSYTAGVGIQAATYHGARFGWFPRKSVATPEDFGRPMLRSRPDRENCDSPPDSPDFEHTAPGGEEKTR